MAREGKAPAFPFYAADWIADGDVLDMTLAQEGAYVRLLAYQWRDGSIPSDEESLCKRLRTQPSEFRRVWALVSRKFHPLVADPARLANGRLEQERIKMLAVREEKKKAAGARWRHPASAPSIADAYADASPPASILQSSASASALASSSALSLSQSSGNERDPDIGWFSAMWGIRANVLINDPAGMAVVLRLVREYAAAKGDTDLKRVAKALLDGYARVIASWTKQIWTVVLFVKHWESVQANAGAEQESIAARQARAANSNRGDS